MRADGRTDEAPFPLGHSATDLHGEDEGLIDTKGLLRRDEQGGGAGERAGREEALAVHLSDHSLVGALQHPVGQRTHAVSGGHRGGKTGSHQARLTSIGRPPKFSAGLCNKSWEGARCLAPQFLFIYVFTYARISQLGQKK